MGLHKGMGIIVALMLSYSVLGDVPDTSCVESDPDEAICTLTLTEYSEAGCTGTEKHMTTFPVDDGIYYLHNDWMKTLYTTGGITGTTGSTTTKRIMYHVGGKESSASDVDCENNQMNLKMKKACDDDFTMDFAVVTPPADADADDMCLSTTFKGYLYDTPSSTNLSNVKPEHYFQTYLRQPVNPERWVKFTYNDNAVCRQEICRTKSPTFSLEDLGLSKCTPENMCVCVGKKRKCNWRPQCEWLRETARCVRKIRPIDQLQTTRACRGFDRCCDTNKFRCKRVKVRKKKKCKFVVDRSRTLKTPDGKHFGYCAALSSAPDSDEMKFACEGYKACCNQNKKKCENIRTIGMGGELDYKCIFVRDYTETVKTPNRKHFGYCASDGVVDF